MGGANNICSDKTGTLTMNKMTVTNIWASRSMAIRVNDENYAFGDYFNNDKNIQLLKQALCLNTIGTVDDSSATEQAMPPSHPSTATEDLVATSHPTPTFLARTIFEMFASKLAIGTDDSAVLHLCIGQDRTEAQMYRLADAIHNMIQRATDFQQVFKDQDSTDLPNCVLHLFAFKEATEELLKMPKSMPIQLKEAKWNIAKRHLRAADEGFTLLGPAV